MSYPHYGLDEHEEGQLASELARRKALREKGLCDYCERAYQTSPCKFPDRHKWSKSVMERMPDHEEQIATLDNFFRQRGISLGGQVAGRVIWLIEKSEEELKKMRALGDSAESMMRLLDKSNRYED